MSLQARVVAACAAVMLISCGSDPVSPTLGELQGEWTMAWTEAASGVTCEWAGVTLSLRDSTKGPPGFWGGGRGSCRGLLNSDNLVLVRFVLDSLTVAHGHIGFIPLGSTYRFEGRVAADEMQGTMTAAPYYEGPGVQVRTAGRWHAVRRQSP